MMFARNFWVLSLALLMTQPTFAANEESDTGPGSRACRDNLEDVADELQRLQDRALSTSSQNNNDNVNNSTTQNGSGGGGGGNPLADVMNKMAEGQQKMAQIAQQAAEQANQLENERFKQLNTLNDKIHDFRKQDFKRRQEIKNAETAKKKKESEIRIACYRKAEEDYNKEFAANALLASQGNYQVNSLSNMKGTTKRMKATLSLHRRRCLNSDITREEMKNVEAEYETKMHNFKIANEEINSDITYTQSKIGMVETHIGGQKAQLAAQAEAQMAAQKQQNQMQMMAMAFGALTTSSAKQEEQKAAERFQDVDEILRNWDDIVMKCSNSTSDFYEVPYDVYPRFTKVNNACRGSAATTSPCVKSSGEASPTRPVPSTTRSS